MQGQRTISILDIIIDRPGWVDLHSVLSDLGQRTIKGLPVMAVLPSAEHTHDAIDIPGPGYTSVNDDWDEELGRKYQYVRTFSHRLIVDGAYRIADYRTNTFRWYGHTMVMVTMVRIVTTDEHDKTPLEPWGYEEEE